MAAMATAIVARKTTTPIACTMLSLFMPSSSSWFSDVASSSLVWQDLIQLLPKTLFVLRIVAVLYHLYRAIVYEEQSRHPLYVVHGGKLPGVILEHGVGNVLFE